ncbi:hypothetical protein D3C71_1820510 [compost metagenome]
MMLSNNDLPADPPQRWMSASGVCSCSRKSRFRACRLRRYSPTDCSGRCATGTGIVLMKSPMMRSTPGRLWGRPATVEPNATVSLRV